MKRMPISLEGFKRIAQSTKDYVEVTLEDDDLSGVKMSVEYSSEGRGQNFDTKYFNSASEAYQEVSRLDREAIENGAEFMLNDKVRNVF